jgi:Holliday junction resolvase-like predicted endonuclease
MLIKAESSPDQAYHASYILLAFEQGCLARLTAPVHRFLLQGSELDQKLTSQYRQDLRERWLLEETEQERHERFRQFFGKMAELQLATWIADSGWSITALEALGGEADIVAVSPGGHLCSFEVKYIGRDNTQFGNELAALTVGDGGGAISRHAAANYLLFRVYEAARRLRDCANIRVAAIVVDALTWHRFRRPLRDGLIAWEAPAFLQAPPEWNDFLATQRPRYPNVDNELAAMVSSLNELWVLTLTEGYEFVLEQNWQFAGGG